MVSPYYAPTVRLSMACLVAVAGSSKGCFLQGQTICQRQNAKLDLQAVYINQSEASKTAPAHFVAANVTIPSHELSALNTEHLL